MRFRVREYPSSKYNKPPLITEEVFDTYEQAKKFADKHNGLVEPHIEANKTGRYEVPDFETGMNDVDQNKLSSRRTLNKNKKKRK